MRLVQGYLLFCVLLSSLVGCTRNHVETFSAQPAEKRLHWNLPAGWSQKYDGDGIRWGSFAGPDAAVITITRFPGSVGDDLANINRWRAQLGLEPVTSARMDVIDDTPLTWKWTWLDNKSEILAGAMTTVDGTTLTLKLSASQANEANLRRDFIKILRELSWK